MADLRTHEYITRRIRDTDPKCGFRCGEHSLDDYFRRHALPNDLNNIGRAYVREASNDEADAGLPAVVAFYTLSMASVQSALLKTAVSGKLPRYPMPVALLGRLAVDERAQGRGLGQSTLMDVLHRVVAAGNVVGCLGVIVDALNENAQRFYTSYDFVPLGSTGWPQRLFLPIETIQAALESD